MFNFFGKDYKELLYFKNMKRVSKRGQIWVETVIYTLIGLAIIGLVLAGALPKINAKKDEVIIGQSIEALLNIDDKIYEVSRAAGNRRVINLEIRKGALIINPVEDTVSWILDSSFAYSEIGLTVPFGNMNVTTTGDENYKVELKLGYKIDIKFEDGNSKEKKFDIAPTPYRLVVENVGKNTDGVMIIDFQEV
jgi:hypothetical protein